ncbi:hypothetical protein [Streptomyces sp. NPDC051218]|uniref:hypothetical protein n=1 Tax=Streptomyces sp. NPDC051218 TaxID=3365645 RepID=UPI003797FEEE
MWRYGVGYSQLLLRSIPEGTDTTCLDVHFEGVAAVQLGTRYTALRLRLANRDERATLKTPLGQAVAVAIDSETGSGLVLCRTVSVLRGGTDALDGIERSKTLWSHSPGPFWNAPLTEAVWSELSAPVRAAIARCDAERLQRERSRLAPRLRPTVTAPVYSMAARFASWERLVRRLERDEETSDQAHDPYPISAFSNDLDSRDSLAEAMATLPPVAHDGALGHLLTSLDNRYTAATAPDPQGSLRPWVRPTAKRTESESNLGAWWKRKPVRDPWI